MKEHPLIRPFPGSILVHNVKHLYHDFGEYSFRVKDAQTGKTSKKKVQGKEWKLRYIILDAKGKWDSSHSILEFRENYKQAALENGGTILYENQGYLTFTLPGNNGSDTWCEVQIWNKSGSTGTDVVKQPSFCHLFIVFQVVTPKSKNATFLLLIPLLKH